MTSPHILFLTRQVPQAGSGGSMLRNLEIIRFLEHCGRISVCAIHMDAQSTGLPAPDGVDAWTEFYIPRTTRRLLQSVSTSFLKRVPLLSHLFYDRAIVRSLNTLLQKNPPDIVIIAEVWLMPYLPLIKKYCAQIIVDMHDVDTVMYPAILKETTSWRDWLRTKLLLSATAYLQPRILAAASQIWTCCRANADVLTILRPGIPVLVIPSTIDSGKYAAVRRGTESLPIGWTTGTEAVLFCGNFSYFPNADAARFLIDAVMPQVWKDYPDAQLLLVGGSPSFAMRYGMYADPRVIVTGYVPDVRPYLSAASVVCIPMRTGVGPRLKMLEAFAARRPVVATHKTIESLDMEPGKHLLIGETSSELAAHIVHLLDDPLLATALEDAAEELLQSQYSEKAVLPLIKKAIEELGAISHSDSLHL